METNPEIQSESATNPSNRPLKKRGFWFFSKENEDFDQLKNFFGGVILLSLVLVALYQPCCSEVGQDHESFQTNAASGTNITIPPARITNFSSLVTTNDTNLLSASKVKSTNQTELS